MIQTLQQLKEKAPSVFATRPHQKMTKQYQFVNTADMIDKFISDGWDLSSGRQSGKGLFTKHEVRLRHGAIPNVGDSIPEIILNNSTITHLKVVQGNDHEEGEEPEESDS
jgi:hypothetical protein